MKQLHKVVLFAFCMVTLLNVYLSVGTTQGRYDNSISWRGVYTPTTVEIETEILSEEGYPVIMADWEINPKAADSQRTYNIRVTAQNGKAEGKLSCQVENNPHYLDAWLDTDILTIDEDGEAFALTLRFTDDFQKEIEKEWNKKKETISSGDVSNGEVSSGDQDDAGLLPISFVVSVNWTQKDEQAPALQAKFVVKVVWSADAIVSGNDATISTYSPKKTVSGADATENEAPVDSVRILSATDSFSWDEWFGLKVFVPEGVAQLELQYSGMAFPVGTRFRVNSGEVMVIGENQEVILSQNSTGEQLILFHMGHVADVYKTNQIVLSITGLSKEGTPHSFDYRTLRADAPPLLGGAKEASQTIEKGGKLTVTTHHGEEELTWDIQYLTRDESGKLVYVTQEDHYGLKVEFYQDVNVSDHRLMMISNDRELAPAGSYRLILQKHYAGAEVAREELPIFILY